MIICFASLKGGSGKSCLSLHLAHAIALSKRKVILIDADPQASVSNWAAVREEPAPFVVVGMARDTLHRDLPNLVTDYDHCVIDTPPRTTAIVRSAVIASDLVLCPVQPSSFDVWAVGETVALVKEAQTFKEGIRAAFVINRRIAQTAIGREVTEALSDYPFPVLKTAIGQRVAFAESSAGYTVMEMAARGQAATEIKGIVKDILKLMGLKAW